MPGDWTVAETVLVLVGLVACVTDLRTRRIPNVLTFGAALAALAFGVITGGLPGAGAAIAGWSVGCAIFLPVYLLRGMGAGDVKLLAALGAWAGPGPAVWIALYAAVAGGVFAVGVSLWRGYLGQLFSNLWGLLMFWRVAGVQPMPSLTLATARGPRLPYALPITAGAVAVLWLR